MPRKSKREIEQQLEDLEGKTVEEYPRAHLVLLLSYEWEIVDKERHLKRRQDTGEIYYCPPLDLEEPEEP